MREERRQKGETIDVSGLIGVLALKTLGLMVLRYVGADSKRETWFLGPGNVDRWCRICHCNLSNPP